MKQKIHLWMSWSIVALGAGWMFVELARVVWQIGSQSGVWAIFGDGVAQHKIGELLIIIPFIIIAINSNFWPPARLRAFLSRGQWAMIAGGLLNGYAWFQLRYRVDWHFWCLALLFWGVVFGPLFGRMMIKIAEKKREKSGIND